MMTKQGLEQEWSIQQILSAECFDDDKLFALMCDRLGIKQTEARRILNEE